MIEAQVKVTVVPPEIRADDMMAIAKKVSLMLLEGVRQQFIEGGRPEKWRPLATGQPSYLYRGGDLLQLIQESTGIDGEVFFAKVSTTGGLPYAAIHQFGGYAGRGHASYIPPRPYMVVTEETEDRIAREVLLMYADMLNKTDEKKREGVGYSAVPEWD